MTLPCASGCPTARIQREPVEFNRDVPHLTLVWSGDRVSNIPVSSAAIGSEPFITLSTEEVITMVEGFLTENGMSQPGLSLRIHSRDPVTE
jgi:hypothetical protein